MAVIQFGTNSEFGRLCSVLLHRPGPEIGNYPDPARIQHLTPIDHHALMREFDAVTACFESHGIVVNLIDPTPVNEDTWYQYNLMYCRDLFFMTPHGAIMASMANFTRMSEPLYAARSLEALGVPLLHSVTGDGRFEGADALWLNEHLVVIGVGNRTNHQGFEQIRAVLQQQGVSCIALSSCQAVTQHLLGSVQIVDRNLALVRDGIIDCDIIRFLRESGFEVVAIPESSEVRLRQSMNIVTIAPRTVIMTAGCPKTLSMYEKAGLTVVAELELTQMICGAGGLACATGIVARC